MGRQTALCRFATARPAFQPAFDCALVDSALGCGWPPAAAARPARIAQGGGCRAGAIHRGLRRGWIAALPSVSCFRSAVFSPTVVPWRPTPTEQRTSSPAAAGCRQDRRDRLAGERWY